MPRVVLDPNVLIAAAITPNGVAGHVLQAMAAGHCTLLLSPLVLGEVDEVLRRPKFRRYRIRVGSEYA